jgi:hypothetical protein
VMQLDGVNSMFIQKSWSVCSTPAYDERSECTCLSQRRSDILVRRPRCLLTSYGEHVQFSFVSGCSQLNCAENTAVSFSFRKLTTRGAIHSADSLRQINSKSVLHEY